MKMILKNSEILFHCFSRRIPVLSFCIQRRGTNLWFRRTMELALDFDVLEDEPEQVIHHVLSTSYNMGKGPLWLARVVNLSPDQPSPRGIRARNHSLVLFGIMHAITDGTTNLTICKEFVDIINNFLKGNTLIHDPYSFSSPHAEKLVHSTIVSRFKMVTDRTYKFILQGCERKTTFNGVLPLPKNYIPDTHVITHVFSEEVSQKLIARCKENKTTVHSCIVTAANISHFDIVQRKASSPVEKVVVHYGDCINLRRYYPEQDKQHIGCHITTVEQKCIISSEGRKDFWKTAREARTRLHESLTDKSCLKPLSCIKYAFLLLLINMFKNKAKKRNLTFASFITTNLKDVTQDLSEQDLDDPVQVTDIFRCCSNLVCGSIFSLTFHTFRRRLYLSFDCFTNKIPIERGQELFDILNANLTDLALTGTLT